MTQSLSFTIRKTLIFNPVVWVGVWFQVLMILAYFVDHYVPFQGISLDFLYLVRGRRRQSPLGRGVVSGIIIIIIIIKITSLQWQLTSHCKSRTLCDQMYAKIHLFDTDRESASGHTDYKVHPVTQIAKVNLVTLFAKAHPLICINDKFSNDLLKILYKSVD